MTLLGKRLILLRKGRIGVLWESKGLKREMVADGVGEKEQGSEDIMIVLDRDIYNIIDGLRSTSL